MAPDQLTQKSRYTRPAVFRARSTLSERPAAFGESLHLLWAGKMEPAIRRLELSRDLAPDDAAIAYFLALAHLRSGDRKLANETLSEAIKIDAARPVPDWGRLMERVQGRQRIWLEEARSEARIQQLFCQD